MVRGAAGRKKERERETESAREKASEGERAKSGKIGLVVVGFEGGG